MFRILFILLAFAGSANAIADETTTTTVNPVTLESTTTTVNQDTHQTTITKVNPDTDKITTTIITPVPAPQETTPAPEGYTNCSTVAAAWVQGVWVPEHEICQYTSTSTTTYQGSTWVSGVWNCTEYRASDGTCTKWSWVAGHWSH